MGGSPLLHYRGSGRVSATARWAAQCLARSKTCLLARACAPVPSHGLVRSGVHRSGPPVPRSWVQCTTRAGNAGHGFRGRGPRVDVRARRPQPMEGDEFADRTSLSRRGVLGGGLALGLGGLLQACGGSATISRSTAVSPAGNDLDAIEHVVFLMMENRSFDHFFGTYPDAKGFDDHPSGSLGPFSQAWANAPAGHVPAGQALPYPLDPATVSAQCAGDNSKPDHGWISQHESWNMGAMDRFVAAHSELAFDGPDQGPLVMAYMTQADVPFLWALAKAYTLCDAFYGSVLGPTMPNRLYYLSGMLPPRRQERRGDRLYPP